MDSHLPAARLRSDGGPVAAASATEGPRALWPLQGKNGGQPQDSRPSRCRVNVSRMHAASYKHKSAPPTAQFLRTLPPSSPADHPEAGSVLVPAASTHLTVTVSVLLGAAPIVYSRKALAAQPFRSKQGALTLRSNIAGLRLRLLSAALRSSPRPRCPVGPPCRSPANPGRSRVLDRPMCGSQRASKDDQPTPKTCAPASSFAS